MFSSFQPLLSSPISTLRATNENFKMLRGVRQGSKEGPIVFNITDQLVLEEIFSSIKGCRVEITSHKECAGDLCPIAPSSATAIKMSEKSIETLHKYYMKTTAKRKTVWLSVGTRDRPTIREAAGMSFKRTSRGSHYGFVTSGSGETDVAVNKNFRKPTKHINPNAPLP